MATIGSRRELLKAAAVAASAFVARQPVVAQSRDLLPGFATHRIQTSGANYRAGMTIDEQHEAETRDRRVTCPLLVLWGERSIVGTTYDPLQLWRAVATDVRGRSFPGGHNLPEELPEQTLSAILEFIVA